VKKAKTSAPAENESPILRGLQEEGWKKVLSPEFEKPYFKDILKFLEAEKTDGSVFYPPENEVMNAFNYTPYDQVRVVLIGQDPYFNADQAHGICFSVKKGVKVPPSLNNIYKEVESNIPGFKKPNHGYLEGWARQGILMLNATLTVRAGKANSHADCGWQKFTDVVIDKLNKDKKGLVFILWGKFAQKKGAKLDKKKHHILEGAHPSPMAKGFSGCGHFAKVNEMLQKEGQPPIDWKALSS